MSGEAGAAPEPRDALAVCLYIEQLRRAVPGGIGTYAGGLVKGLKELGERHVTLLASATAKRPDPLEALGYAVSTIRLPGPLLVRLADRGLLRLRRGGRVLPPGLAAAHSVSSALPPLLRGSVPMTVMVHDLAWRTVPGSTTRRGAEWHEAALRRAARHADRLVVPSGQTAEELLGAGLGIADERVVVIEEGVDHLAPLDDAARAAGAARLRAIGLDGRPYLLSVGTLEPRKNLSRVVEAYATVAGRRPDVPALVLVGPKGWGPRLVAAAGVHLAGKVSPAELTGLYAGAVAVVYVPLSEGFGLPAAEAMSLGVPVVASRRVPSVAGAALEVEAGDAGSIADGLERVLGDDATRRAVVEAGLERTARFRWSEAARSHVALWRALAHG